MSLEEQVAQQQAPAGPQAPQGPGGPQNLSDEEELDLKIAVLMGENLLQKGGFDVIDKAVSQSSDPSQVIGQFMMQLGQQLMENMPDDIQLSPKILLAKHGWVEQISDYIQSEAHVPKKVMDKAEIYVASTASQMAQAKQQQGQGAIDGVQAPPVPGPNQPIPAPQGGAQ